MQRFKLGFRNKSAIAQLGICEQTVAGLSAKPEHLLDAGQLTDVSAAVAAARASHQRIESLRSELTAEISNRNALLKSARDQVTRICSGVASKTAMDGSKMREAGLDLEASKTSPVGKPSAPGDLRASPTEREGEVLLRWERPVRRCAFEVQLRQDGASGDWKGAGICLKQKFSVQGLKSGVKYWFRVRATNAHGGGAWSKIVPIRAK